MLHMLLALSAHYLSMSGTAAKRTSRQQLLSIVRLGLEWLTVPVFLTAMQLPQAVLVYWVSSSAAALLQVRILAAAAGFSLSATAPMHASSLEHLTLHMPYNSACGWGVIERLPLQSVALRDRQIAAAFGVPQPQHPGEHQQPDLETLHEALDSHAAIEDSGKKLPQFHEVQGNLLFMRSTPGCCWMTALSELSSERVAVIGMLAGSGLAIARQQRRSGKSSRACSTAG